MLTLLFFLVCGMGFCLGVLVTVGVISVHDSFWEEKEIQKLEKTLDMFDELTRLKKLKKQQELEQEAGQTV